MSSAFFKRVFTFLARRHGKSQKKVKLGRFICSTEVFRPSVLTFIKAAQGLDQIKTGSIRTIYIPMDYDTSDSIVCIPPGNQRDSAHIQRSHAQNYYAAYITQHHSYTLTDSTSTFGGLSMRHCDSEASMIGIEVGGCVN